MSPEQIGRYRIVRLLGRGGMGTVYEALDENIEHRVAIKILHPEFASTPDIVDRFLNEARAANRIGHASVVKVSEWGRLESGQAYLVMEYLDGITLGQRLKDAGGWLPLGAALTIGSQLAEALDAGHRKGIVHRDLKPDNVKLVADSAVAAGERCKLFDFGIAKVAVSGGQPGATQTAMMIGTVGYMPPEQIRDASRVSERSDVYALGVLLFQMIAGRRPFAASNDADLMAMVLRDQPPRLDTLVPEIPPELTVLVAHMLATELADRPSMGEVIGRLRPLRDAIAPVASGGPGEPLRRQTSTEANLETRVPNSRPSGARGPIAEPTSTSGLRGENASSAGGPRSSLRRLLAIPLGITIGFVGIGGYALFSHRGPRPEVPAQPALPLHDNASVLKNIGGSLGASAQPQPPLAPPKDPLPAAAPRGDSGQSPGKSTVSKPSVAEPKDNPPPTPKLRKSEFATTQCIQTFIPLAVKSEIVQALKLANVRIPPSESVRFLLQGSGLVIVNRPDFIPAKREPGLLKLLASYQIGQELPSGVREIVVQCKKGKP